MKFNKYLIAVAAVLLLLSFSAFARSKDSGSLSLLNPTKLGTTELKPGSYQVRWTGPTDNVNVDGSSTQQNRSNFTSKNN